MIVKCCETCIYYHWYYEKCEKWDFETDLRSVCDDWEYDVDYD